MVEGGMDPPWASPVSWTSRISLLSLPCSLLLPHTACLLVSMPSWASPVSQLSDPCWPQAQPSGPLSLCPQVCLYSHVPV